MGLNLFRNALIGLLVAANALRPVLFNENSLIRVTRSIANSQSKLCFKVAESDDRVAVKDDKVVVEDVVEFQELGDSTSGVFQKLSKGFIPLAASIGFAVTPSPLIAKRLAGAAAGGVAGLVAKVLLSTLSRRSESKTESETGGGSGSGGVNVPATATVVKTLNALLEGPPITTLAISNIEKTARQHRVASEDLGELFTSIFAEVIYDAVTTDSADLTELSEVSDFAKDMGLSVAEIGDAFSLAASKISELLDKDSRGFYTATYSPDIMLYTAKIFFLADKLMESEQGFYGSRFTVAISYFTPESLRDMVTDVSTDLFQKCIRSVLTDPSKFSSAEVDNLRDFLACSPRVSGMRPASMQSMAMEFLQASLDKALIAGGESALDARVSNYDELQKAQEILGWTTREFSSTVETRTLPVFEDAARQLINEAMEHPDRANELAVTLRDRIEALNIDMLKARVCMTTLISEKNSEYMFKIEKVYNASGRSVEPVFKIMSSYADAHAALRTLAEGVMDGVSIPVPGLPFADMVRVSLFELQQKQKDPSVTSDMFSLNEEQQRIVKKNMALPKVTSWISQCISEGTFNDNAKSAYRKLFKENGVSDEEWRATSVDFYYQEVQRIASTRAVPSEADMLRLEALRNFLDCPEEAVGRVHLELLGDKYAKALAEAMTPSGVITEEYENGLERLRKRLALREEDKPSLLGLVTRNRLAPLMKDLAAQWKSDTTANAREKGRKDKSGDLISSQDNVLGFMETGAQKTGGGPNVFMREALNFIELSAENYRMVGIDISSMEKPPVTAVGVLPEADLIGVFKHYLITELSEQDEVLRARYYANENVFGLLLGIATADQSKVKESLAYSAYKNMLKNVMRYKDAVGTDELRQFAVLKDSLGLDQEDG